MGLFGRKKQLDESASIMNRLDILLPESFTQYPNLKNGSAMIHVPIWYVFKDGHSIDLNNPSLIIEDWSGEYGRLRHIGKIKIKAWQKLNQVLSIGKKLAMPEIVFYE